MKSFDFERSIGDPFSFLIHQKGNKLVSLYLTAPISFNFSSYVIVDTSSAATSGAFTSTGFGLSKKILN